jgi:hypothetical protein
LVGGAGNSPSFGRSSGTSANEGMMGVARARR